MKLKNSIIIHGPGKSGTTLLNDILALHPDLYWISTYLNRYPGLSLLSILNNLHTSRIVENYSRSKRKFPRPAEAFHFFSHYIHDFRLNRSSFDPVEIKSLQQALHRIGNFQKGERLISKITGPSRADFLEQVFENPYVIWIDREPKSIIASYFKYKWRYKDREEQFAAKPKKDLIKEYTDYYHWIKKEKERLRHFRFKKVSYEAFIEDPNGFFQDLCLFLDLDYSSSFQKTVLSWNIRKNTNEQYKKFFNEEELEYLNSLLTP